MCSNIILLVWNTVVVLLILDVNSGNGEVRRDEFFPFGPFNGDTTLNADDVGSHSDLITLKTSFNFFNTSHSTLYVNNYGNILFSDAGFAQLPSKCNSAEMSKSGPLIAPFWSVVHTENGGHVYYRETKDSRLKSKAQNEMNRGFPGAGGPGHISLESLFIVTWDNVTHYRPSTCPDDNLRNTFQAILATDGRISFVIFYYNELTWTLYTRGVGSRCVAEDDYPAAAGFTAGLGHTFHDVLGKCESDVLKLTEKSNVGQMGKWVFRVDGEIQSPTYREYIKTQASIQHDTSHPSHRSGIPVSNSTDPNEFAYSVSNDGNQSSVKLLHYVLLVIILCIHI